jgi:hypothetical protein
MTEVKTELLVSEDYIKGIVEGYSVSTVSLLGVIVSAWVCKSLLMW